MNYQPDIIGVYYLHSNGSLIFKDKNCFINISIEDYFDSDFVKKYWIMTKEAPAKNKKDCIKWTMDWLYEAFTLGAKKEEIKRICDKNEFPEIIFNTIIEGKRR